MTLPEFTGSLNKSRPPARLPAALLALWWAGKDKWDEAHRIVMNEESKECAWVHAYLHRREGDRENARYWYRQAKRPVATGTLPTEWNEIAHALLADE
jgi:hypothetical protein